MASLSSKTGFTPVQTRVTLANNATTSVQEFAAYDGQELTGFVFIDATTDYRATVKIQVVKNGAGTYEVAAADIAGDDNGGSPIVSFSMSGSILQATLVSYAGFVSAYIQYNLNAPVLGGNFPLTVDGSNVTLATASVQGAYKAGQAPGLTTGAAISAGYVGEKITWSTPPSNIGAIGTSITDWTNATFTLTAGVWMIVANISVSAATGGSSGNETSVQISITDSSNAIVQNQAKQITSTSPAAAVMRVIGVIPFSFIENINSSKTYKIRYQRVDGLGTGSGSVYNQSPVSSEFYAIRIA